MIYTVEVPILMGFNVNEKYETTKDGRLFGDGTFLTPDDVKFLSQNGWLKAVEEQKYKIGNKYMKKSTGEVYILAQCCVDMLCLIHLKSGNRYKDASICDIENGCITKYDFYTLCGTAGIEDFVEVDINITPLIF